MAIMHKTNCTKNGGPNACDCRPVSKFVATSAKHCANCDRPLATHGFNLECRPAVAPTAAEIRRRFRDVLEQHFNMESEHQHFSGADFEALLTDLQLEAMKTANDAADAILKEGK